MWGWRYEMKKEPATFLLSATATVLITGGIIIAHDLSGGFKQFLIDLTGHHWTSVSIIAAVLFIMISLLVLSSEKLGTLLKANDLKIWSRGLAAATLLAILGTFIVYIYTTLR
jgi:cadmium resistance protein CadD (predicted permease)